MTEITVLDLKGSMDALTNASHAHALDGTCVKNREGERCASSS